jgi:hypothetical protein
MKHKSLRDKAKLIDRLIDAYVSSRGVSFVPSGKLEELVSIFFPEACLESSGWHKTALRIIEHKRVFVLKIGAEETIENDHRVFKRLPVGVRRELFAEVFWHTKYCLLQEYGVEVEVSAEELRRLRDVGYRYGVIDVKEENVRLVGGRLKIVDANVVSERFSGVWRLFEVFKFSLPGVVVDFLRRIWSRR